MNYDMSKPSRAVIVSNGDAGTVVWWVGGDLWAEVKEARLYDMGDLGMDVAPPGVWVWEGLFRPNDPPEGTIPYEVHYSEKALLPGYSGPKVSLPPQAWPVPRGGFRAPTDEEWLAIRSNQNPWNDEEWLSHE